MLAAYCHASKKISKSSNCLVSDFWRCWAHTVLFNFNYECVHSAVLRTEHLEPMQAEMQRLRGTSPRPPLWSLWSHGEDSSRGTHQGCGVLGQVWGWPGSPLPAWLSPACSAQVQSSPVMNMDLWQWWILKWISNYSMPMLVEVASRRLVRKKKCSWVLKSLWIASC